MRVIKMRDGAAIYIEKDFDIDSVLGSNKRFIKIGDMIINRADITAVVSKEQYDIMVKQSMGMVYTNDGWMGKQEYKQNSFRKAFAPEELTVFKEDIGVLEEPEKKVDIVDFED